MEKRLALITGGTSGIGFGAAKALAGSCDLALGYASNHERAQKAKEALLEHEGCRVELFSQHLAGYDDAKTLFDNVVHSFGKPPEILINSSGKIKDGFFLQTDSSTAYSGTSYRYDGDVPAGLEINVWKTVWQNYQSQLNKRILCKTWAGKLCRSESRDHRFYENISLGSCPPRYYRQFSCPRTDKNSHDIAYCKLSGKCFGQGNRQAHPCWFYRGTK